MEKIKIFFLQNLKLPKKFFRENKPQITCRAQKKFLNDNHLVLNFLGKNKNTLHYMV